MRYGPTTRAGGLLIAFSLCACAGAHPSAHRASSSVRVARDAQILARRALIDARRTRERQLRDQLHSSSMVFMTPRARAEFRARTHQLIAHVRFELDDLYAATLAIEDAYSESKDAGDFGLTAQIAKDRYLILHYRALQATRRSDDRVALRILDRMSRLPGLTLLQRQQIAGDRFFVIDRMAESKEPDPRALWAAVSRILAPEPSSDAPPVDEALPGH